MNQALDAIFDTREGAEGGQLRDRPFDDLPQVIAIIDRRPRLVLGALDRERDALAIVIDAQNIHFDFVARLQHLAGMLDPTPRKLRKMHQPVGTADIDKSPEIGDRGNYAGADIPLLERCQQFVFATLAHFLYGLAFGKDESITI